MSQKRCWIITVNNPDAWMDVSEWDGLRYAVWQLEMGENGTPHYQMYLNFKRSVRLGTIKKLEGLERCHAEARRGTKVEAVAYCSKEDSRLEGPYWFPSEMQVRAMSNVEEGGRSDLKYLCELVKADWTDKMIAEEEPKFILKFQKNINDLRLAYSEPGRTGAVIDSVVYVGPSGTGKSYRLRRECPPGDEWFWVSPGKWFDGYQGQVGLVFDEFRDNWQTYSYMLKLLDLYPFKVERKGGMIEMKATRFRFSSNEHPKAWWDGRAGKVAWADDPLRRRLKRIVLMDQVWDEDDDIQDDAEAWWSANAPAVRAVFGERQE